MSFQEKRIADRIKHPFLTKMRALTSSGSVDPASKWDIVTLRNLSASGLLFNYGQVFPIGILLEFSISLVGQIQPVNCIGEVCRVDQQNVPDTNAAANQLVLFSVAVRFKEMDADSQAMIKKLSQSFQSRMQS